MLKLLKDLKEAEKNFQSLNALTLSKFIKKIHTFGNSSTSEVYDERKDDTVIRSTKYEANFFNKRYNNFLVTALKAHLLRVLNIGDEDPATRRLGIEEAV